VKDLPIRKHPRLKGYNYSRNGVYFITFCIKGQHEMLGRVVVGRGIPDAPCIELSEYGGILMEAFEFLNNKTNDIVIRTTARQGCRALRMR